MKFKTVGLLFDTVPSVNRRAGFILLSVRLYAEVIHERCQARWFRCFGFAYWQREARLHDAILKLDTNSYRMTLTGYAFSPSKGVETIVDKFHCTNILFNSLPFDRGP